MSCEKKRKYNPLWENEIDFKGWLRKHQEGEEEYAYCKICLTKIRPHKADIKKHFETPKHKKMCNIVEKQPRLQTWCNLNREKKAKEITIAFCVAVHTSIRSADCFIDVFNKISGVDPMHQLHMHRTKCCSVIKKVIAPALLEELFTDIGDSYFSLLVDESTDVSSEKYLCLCIKYYSQKENSVITHFLALLPVIETTSKELYETICNYLHSIKLNIKNLIGLGTDGASNLCGKNNSLFTLLKARNPNIILSKCICHSLNLCASKASEVFSDNVDFMLKETYNWFSHSPLRMSKYKQIWSAINTDGKFLKLIQLSPTRWLARYQAVDRICTQYIELETLFQICALDERCYKANILANIYKDKKNKLILLFLKPILKTINCLNLYFQKDSIDFNMAIEEIIITINSLARRVFKDDFLSLCENVFEIENGINDLSTQLDINYINYGNDFNEEVNTLEFERDDLINIRQDCKSFIIKLIQEMIARLPSHIEVFEKFKIFTPEICLHPVKRPSFSELPLYLIEKEKLEDAEIEYNKLLSFQWSNIFNEIPSDTLLFWKNVSLIKTASGNLMFPNISKCAFALLSLPGSNATVERVFSTMNCVKTKLRNKLLPDTINAILRVKFYCYVKDICCNKFAPSEKMLTKFNSNMYVNSNSKEDTEILDVFGELEA